MARQPNIHVAPNPHGGWEVRREGASRPVSTHRTQAAADRRARALARRDRVELVIHDRHGRIRNKDSFGHDPFPPRDRVH
ncbi:MAG: DUF2188 domain-containing protein [Candidatus Kerfeldbacteria bacterium]|nr:DUF2188 domain-containing protein [Candidatus Kerfeldbacteria bacterium]